mmetsp:Transcript_8400/g.20857  ORF Transcript_8400/g.20857 Transcript_8400/m.20857 type:complete len:684 (-) Transcript_8400:189-2240(-)
MCFPGRVENADGGIQAAISRFYNSDLVQLAIAALIALNFLIALIEAEFNWEWLDTAGKVLTVTFAVELVVNFVGSAFWRFWRSGWNWFDTCVVGVSLAELFFPELPGVTSLRLFRAFRVVRIFKRLKSLRRVCNSLFAAIPQVGNIMLLMCLIMGIWSVLAVDFFGGAMPEEFGTTARAYMSFFQIMTFDSWISKIVRTAVLTRSSPGEQALSALLFFSFAIVVGLLLMNIVIVVLFDTYIRQDFEAAVLTAAPGRGGASSVATGVAREKRASQAPKSFILERFRPPQRQRASTSAMSTATLGSRASQTQKQLWVEEAEKTIYAHFAKVEAVLHPELPSSRQWLRDAKTNGVLNSRSYLAGKIERRQGRLPYQRKVAAWYNNVATQYIVAFLIFANFGCALVEAQVQDPARGFSDLFKILEYIFTGLFAAELIFNMYGHFFFSFWESPWNWFDFVVVVSSVVSLAVPDMPGITVLRLFRAFRVFRLFKRLKSLQLVVTGLFASLRDAFAVVCILALLTGIWSVLAVDFLGEDYDELFGSFCKAMLTWVQVMTYDAWASEIMGPILEQHPNYWWMYMLFFAYLFMTSMLLLSVVIAILLDKYLMATNPPKLHLDDAKIAVEKLTDAVTQRVAPLSSNPHPERCGRHDCNGPWAAQQEISAVRSPQRTPVVSRRAHSRPRGNRGR